ncbi:MAG: carboxymuconolactone decarboxylase family protein [Proteobacteria bacterium]|nr:carboxymuconolactone decarboxylase family protein [Pseudomonadota bacterium]
MARVGKGAVTEVSEEDGREIYELCAESFGIKNQLGVLANRPPILKNLMKMYWEVAQEQLVPLRYIEIGVLTASKLNACEYCITQHTPRLIGNGLSPESALNLLEPDCPGLDDADRLVRDYAAAVTRHAAQIPDELFARLKEKFSDAQIVELTVRIGLAGFFNRLNEALEIEIEDGAQDAFQVATRISA